MNKRYSNTIQTYIIYVYSITLQEKILHLSDFCPQELSQKSSEPGAEVLQQSKLLAPSGPRLLDFILEAATEEVEEDFMSIFVNFPQVVTKTRKYLNNYEDCWKSMNHVNQHHQPAAEKLCSAPPTSVKTTDCFLGELSCPPSRESTTTPCWRDPGGPAWPGCWCRRTSGSPPDWRGTRGVSPL